MPRTAAATGEFVKLSELTNSITSRTEILPPRPLAGKSAMGVS